MRHYSIHTLDSFEQLTRMFPEGLADEANFALFSTSGVHGSYRTIEECLADGDSVTVVVCRPRLISMIYGNVKVTPENVGWLKRLRQSSWNVVQTIGRDPR